MVQHLCINMEMLTQISMICKFEQILPNVGNDVPVPKAGAADAIGATGTAVGAADVAVGGPKLNCEVVVAGAEFRIEKTVY